MRLPRHASQESSLQGATCRPIREGSGRGFLLLIPFLLCIGFTVSKLLPRVPLPSVTTHSSRFSRDTITTRARETMQSLTGRPTKITQVNQQVFSSAQGDYIAWEMTCETEAAKYVVSFNDATGHVYSLERTYPASEEEKITSQEITRADARKAAAIWRC